MAHVHTGPREYDHTVSGFIVRIDLPQPAMLMHRHRLLKKWLQFGGHIETNENPWEALRHELREESGYDMSQLQLLQPRERLTSLSGALLHPVPCSYNSHAFGDNDHYHTDISFAFTTTEPPRHAIAKGESTDIRLFTGEELKTLPSSEIMLNVRQVALFVLETCLPYWAAIAATSFGFSVPRDAIS